VSTQTSAHGAIVVGQSWSTTLSTLALLLAVGVAVLAIRGWLPPGISRLKKPLSATSLIGASLLVVLTGGTNAALVTVGIAA
jgi:hypothetical protein